MIPTVYADVHNLRRQLERRQVPAECTTPCGWLTALSNCATTDLSCLCGVVLGAGTNVNTCATCLQSLDPTISNDILQVAQVCAGSGATPITEPGPVTSGSSTVPGGTPTVVTETDCGSLCAPLATAEASCGADSCLCPTVVVAGPACSQCLMNVNVTLASSVGLALSLCNSEFPTATTTAAPIGCSGECSLINQALTACTDESCFCTTLIGQGPACSQCYATVNVTEASILSAAILTCQSLLPGVTGIPSSSNTTTTSRGPAATTSTPKGSSSQTVTLNTASPSSQSGGRSDFDRMVGGSFVLWVTVLILIAGMFEVFI